MDELSISLCWSSLGIHIFRLMFVLSQPGYSNVFVMKHHGTKYRFVRLKIGSSFFSPLKYHLFGDFGVYTPPFSGTPQKNTVGSTEYNIQLIYIYIYIYTYIYTPCFDHNIPVVKIKKNRVVCC